MAAGKTAAEAGTRTPEQKTIESWARDKNVSGAELAGIKVGAGWAAGKMVSEKEFDAARKDFSGGSADGRKKV